MKKNFKIFLVAIMIIILIFGINVCALESENGSVTMGEFGSILDINADNTFEIYNGEFIYCFANNLSIEEMLGDNIILDSYYVVFSKNTGKEHKHTVYSVNNNQAKEVKEMEKAAGFFYDGNSDYIKKLLTLKYDASIKNIYFLSGAAITGHLYVYYQTDNGNYVLFRNNINDTESYLVSEDEFCSFSKELWDNYRRDLFKDGREVKGGSDESITVKIPSTWKKIKINKFSASELLIVTCVGVCVITAVFLINKKLNFKKR